jgi:hypothetical protein
VKDLRTGVETGNVDAALDSKLDDSSPPSCWGEEPQPGVTG